jgi:hypothetical protein
MAEVRVMGLEDAVEVEVALVGLKDKRRLLSVAMGRG